MSRFDDIYDDYVEALGIPEYNNWRTPMTDKPFRDAYNHYSTLDEAIKGASRRAVKNMDEITIYQAVKKISPKAPEVDVTDVTLPA